MSSGTIGLVFVKDAAFELQEGERNVAHKSWSSGTGSGELQDVQQVLVLQISVGGRAPLTVNEPVRLGKGLRDPKAVG